MRENGQCALLVLPHRDIVYEDSAFLGTVPRPVQHQRVKPYWIIDHAIVRPGDVACGPAEAGVQFACHLSPARASHFAEVHRPDLILGVLEPNVQIMARPIAIHPGSYGIWLACQTCGVDEYNKILIGGWKVVT